MGLLVLALVLLLGIAIGYGLRGRDSTPESAAPDPDVTEPSVPGSSQWGARDRASRGAVGPWWRTSVKEDAGDPSATVLASVRGDSRSPSTEAEDAGQASPDAATPPPHLNLADLSGWVGYGTSPGITDCRVLLFLNKVEDKEDPPDARLAKTVFADLRSELVRRGFCLPPETMPSVGFISFVLDQHAQGFLLDPTIGPGARVALSVTVRSATDVERSMGKVEELGVYFSHGQVEANYLASRAVRKLLDKFHWQP